MSSRKGSQDYESFLDPEDLAGVEVVDVRISDNVLDPEDWTVDRFAIIEGRLQHLGVRHKGMYGSHKASLNGKTVEELAAWSQWNATGQHPETYCEVRVVQLFRPEVRHAANA